MILLSCSSPSSSTPLLETAADEIFMVLDDARKNGGIVHISIGRVHIGTGMVHISVGRVHIIVGIGHIDILVWYMLVFWYGACWCW